MSIKRSIAANYASQIYTTLIGIALVPVYLQTMGSEAYGLVGFFAMLQAWFNLLDLGLTPTIARESARFHGGAMTALAYRRLYRSLSLVFMAIALVGGAGLFFVSRLVATHWLNSAELAVADVVAAVQVMALCVALRWMGGLYRGVVSGSEQLVWLSGFNAAVASLRFVGVLLSMWLWGFTPAVFFWHQLAVAAIEFAWLLAMCHSLLPTTLPPGEAIGWSFKPIQPLLRFSLTIAFTSSVWVLVTQSDKLILSGILPLAEYGYYSLAVLVAGGITIILGPISTALLPRMARLHAEGHHKALLRLYGQSTQLTAVVAGSATVTITACAGPLLMAWSGDQQLRDAASTTLQLYSIGNGLLAFGAFPYYLQYAQGDLRYHLLGNLLMILFLVPSIFLMASRFGALGAGLVWVTANAIYLLVWVAYVHGRLMPRMHWSWLFNGAIKVIGPTMVVGFVLAQIDVSGVSRLGLGAYVVCVALACFATALVMADGLRGSLLASVRPTSLE